MHVLNLSDSARSKPLTILDDAGCIEMHRVLVDKRARSSAKRSSAGRQPFRRHVAALHHMVSASGASILTQP